MGTQISIPFAVLENGAVSVETDQAVQVLQRIDAIVSTELGQRAMRADMGLPLSQLLFDANNSLIASELGTLVTQQLNTFEPGIEVLSVTPKTDQANDGVAAVSVNYRPLLQASASSSVANVVTVEVGGTVKEVTVSGNS
jgi:phage baseplate assembly protein W